MARRNTSPAPPERWSNTEILHMDPVMFPSQADRARLYALRVVTRERPCPACGAGVSRVAASGLPLDRYPALDEPTSFRCPSCDTPLAPRLPIIAADGPFTWQILNPGARDG